MRAADKIELVAAPVAKPAIEQAMVEPGAPAPLLSSAFVQENFDFFARTLNGSKKLLPRGAAA